MRRSILFLIILFIAFSNDIFSEEPLLPAGLDDNNLVEEKKKMAPEEPFLPLGLDEDSNSIVKAGKNNNIHQWQNIIFSGFIEGRIGTRIYSDRDQKSLSIAEVRSNIDIEKSFKDLVGKFSGDFLLDQVDTERDINLEEGRGAFDLRELNVLLPLSNHIDIKLGRQVLTWGTGDFVFINDLFPKDWNSFFIGRDDEYLKAPSDGIRALVYSDFVNLDIVYLPIFDSDRFIDGRRISFYNSSFGFITGRSHPVVVDHRYKAFREDEIALRLFRNINGYELALYGYFGYWKSPEGFNLDGGLATYPKLNVYGGSARGALLGGISNIEFGYYDSRDDTQGLDPFIRNSEVRFLTGFEKEVLPELTINFQYYLEHILDYGAFLKTLPSLGVKKDMNRHVFTIRATKLALNQNLKLSLFNFFSPSDNDGYLRASCEYRFNDNITALIGGNVFYGQSRKTFFGQFKNASNIFLALRYGFVS